MNKKEKTLCLVAGGSAGHILPALELGREWLAQQCEGKVLLFTHNKALENSVVQSCSLLNHICYLTIARRAGGIKKLPTLLIIIAQFIKAFCKSFWILKRFKPETIISTGGLIALPVCLAAWLQRIPITLYEPNATAGKAMKMLGLLATTIKVSFPSSIASFTFFGKTIDHKSLVTPYPLSCKKPEVMLKKSTILRSITMLAASTNKNTLPFQESKKTLLILGGSQGSCTLNSIVHNIFERHPSLRKTAQVIHQTGHYDKRDWSQFYRQNLIPAFVFPYRHNLEECYAAADIILCRAGAGTLFEILSFKKPSIVVPLITNTTDHQKDNADQMNRLHPELFIYFQENQQEKIEEYLTNFFNSSSLLAHQESYISEQQTALEP